MARHRESILRWGNKYDGPNNYKHNRRGASEDEFWDEDELVDYRSKKSKSKKKRAGKHEGCAYNEGKAHVYVWEKEVIYKGKWSSYLGWVSTDEVNYFYYKKVCCGCNKVAARKYDWKAEGIYDDRI